VIRVADEVLVDLMCSAGGIDYEEAARDVAIRQVDGVPVQLGRECSHGIAFKLCPGGTSRE